MMEKTPADFIKEGRISYDQFVDASKRFVQLSKEYNDAWEIKGDENNYGELFLSCTFTRNIKLSQLPSSSNDATDEPCFSVIEEKTFPDPTSCVSTNLMQFRYDVTFSVSYGLPVLYFMISHPSGKLLSLDEMLSVLNVQDNLDINSKELWNVATVQDHPILNVPFFCVHPCKNWDLLKECFNKMDNPSCLQFLISWISIIGNNFGLNLSSKYYLAK